MRAITPETQPTTTETPAPSFGADFEILREALAIAQRQQPHFGIRLTRAAEIVALCAIERGEAGWLVQSQSRPDRWHLVQQDAFGIRCLCEDAHRKGNPCKHALAVRLQALCEKLIARRASREQAEARWELTPLGEAALGDACPVAHIA